MNKPLANGAFFLNNVFHIDSLPDLFYNYLILSKTGTSKMTTAQLFNVGDIVVSLNDLQFWDNPYHFQKALNSLTTEVVASINQNQFTTKESINLGNYNDCSDWKNEYYIYNLTNGMARTGHKQVHNWTTNEKNIRAYIQKQFDESLAKCTKEDEDTIAKLEAEIRHKQAQIEAIKAGNRPLSYNNKINEREFLNARIQDITKILDSF